LGAGKVIVGVKGAGVRVAIGVPVGRGVLLGRTESVGAIMAAGAQEVTNASTNISGIPVAFTSSPLTRHFWPFHPNVHYNYSGYSRDQYLRAISQETAKRQVIHLSAFIPANNPSQRPCCK